MYRKTIYLLLILLLSVLAVNAGGECETCLKNGAYCVDDKNYYLCPSGTVKTNMKGKCDDATFCTDGMPICGVEAEAACKDEPSKGCKSCATTGFALTCVSRSQFADCKNLGDVFDCDPDEVCTLDLVYANAETNIIPSKICVPQDVLDFLELKPLCNTEAVTPAPPKPLEPTDLNQLCIDKAKGNANIGTWFYMYYCADKTCQNYIYCESANSSWVGSLFKCRDGFYWNPSKQSCVAEKPSGCPTGC